MSELVSLIQSLKALGLSTSEATETAVAEIAAERERAAAERERAAAERAAAERAAERACELICYFIMIFSLNLQLNCESTDNLELEKIKQSGNILKGSAGN